MSVGSIPEAYRSWRYPEEEGYDSALKDLNPFKLDDLDSDASYSSDVEFTPWSETESDVSDDEIEKAQQADNDYFNRSLYSRFKEKMSANFLTIGLTAVVFASALYFSGLPSEDQAKETGFKDGMSESMSAARYALSYVEKFSGAKITELFTQYINRN